ncbi:HNH endonuclease [Actinospica durhamensis]|uniref:HNH endonuclease n=1 Tax=Actinospica durhamensis TaxID=1508375 RepID=A0A941F0Q7_9ACTN|nr:HNH endonuclease [Actinospica durhamensis]
MKPPYAGRLRGATIPHHPRSTASKSSAYANPPQRSGHNLHAHHTTPYAQGGHTTVENLKLYCSHHHTVIHHG